MFGMIDKRTIQIALIGDSPETTTWKQDIIEHFRCLEKMYPDSSLSVRFQQTINPSLVPFVSVGSLGAQTVDIILCREQLLAAQSDITVFIDSGISNETLKRHTDRIERHTKVLVLWSPDVSHKTVKPIEKDEVGVRPVVVYLICTSKMLVNCLYYLCLDSDLSFVEEIVNSSITE
jgi:hypothetical protein